MGVFRSEEFVHRKIRIPRDNASLILNELGQLEDCLEFIDLNKEDLDAKKNFSQMIKRCEELDKKITCIQRKCTDYGMHFEKYQNFPSFKRDLDLDISLRLYGNYFDIVESEVIEDERRLIELIDSFSQIEETLETLNEKRGVFHVVSWLVNNKANIPNANSHQGMINSSDLFNSNDVEADDGWGMLNFLSGAIKADDELKMSRMIFRISKGRAVTYFYDLPEYNNKFLNTYQQENLSNINEVNLSKHRAKSAKKKVFTVFFQRSEENVLKMKVLKILDIFSASRYNIPCPSQIANSINKINNDIAEKLNFLREAEKSIQNFLSVRSGGENLNSRLSNGERIGDEIGNNANLQLNINDYPLDFRISNASQNLNINNSPSNSVNSNPSSPSKYEMYRYFFKKEKLIYSTLNKCLLRDNFIDGEVWIPSNKLEQVTSRLNSIFSSEDHRTSASLINSEIDKSHPHFNPPTYIQSSDFLWSFQEIVNTYGLPRYGEVNPTYFNIITFPFLFGVMFGDIGHGFLLFIFGAYLCLFNNRISQEKDSLLKPMLKGRHLILLMGFFAFYCGWIYNDFFSLPIEVVPSCYDNVLKNNTVLRSDNDCVYPFGIDPKWHASTNELAFFNSFKMKMSVILGVLHMLFGILLKGVNDLYFGDKLDFSFIFLPQFVFMTILFGYMDLQIYVKWFTNWEDKGRKNAPNLISSMMYIFLKFGSVEDKPLIGGDEKYGDKYLQEWINLVILGLSLILIPVMLLVKPIIESIRAKKKINPAGFERLIDGNNFSKSNSNYNESDSKDLNFNRINDKSDYSIKSNKDSVGFNHDNSHSDDASHSFSEIFIHQVIETIEFVLGSVSNTASYLRLWALSLAHSQLSKVFFQKTLGTGLREENVFLGVLYLSVGYIGFATATFVVLMLMDAMECFLHTLRLHWYK